MTFPKQAPSMNRRRFAGLATAAAGSLCAPWALGAAGVPYPSRPIQLIVPFGAGGGTDLFARVLANSMAGELKQSLVVENKPGAGGIIGTDYAARAAPDGYTVAIGSIGTHAANASLFARLPYDAERDFAPISMLNAYNNVLFVHPSFPVTTLAEFIRRVKANPGRFTYGIGSNGASSHLAIELLKSLAGLDMVGVAYKSVPAAYNDLLGGQIPIFTDTLVTALPHIRAGSVRPLATTALQRAHALPDIPTVAESGFKGFEAVGWNGLFAPAKTPPEIIERLRAATHKALASHDFDKLVADGVDLRPSSPQELRSFMKAERLKWAQVIKAAGIRAQ